MNLITPLLMFVVVFSNSGLVTGCSVLYATTTTRSFTSHYAYDGYSDEYDANTDQCWEIRVSSGLTDYVVRAYSNDFDLEWSNGCRDDYVQFRDGSYYYSELIDQYCGTGTLSSQYSTGRYMYIRFKTDSRTHGTGFRIYYKASSDSSGSGYLDSTDSETTLAEKIGAGIGAVFGTAVSVVFIICCCICLK